MTNMATADERDSPCPELITMKKYILLFLMVFIAAVLFYTSDQLPRQQAQSSAAHLNCTYISY